MANPSGGLFAAVLAVCLIGGLNLCSSTSHPDEVRATKVTLVDANGREVAVIDAAGVRSVSGGVRLEPSRLVVEGRRTERLIFRTEVSAAGLRLTKVEKDDTGDEVVMSSTLAPGELRTELRVVVEGAGSQFSITRRGRYQASEVELEEGRSRLRLNPRGLEAAVADSFRLTLEGREASLHLGVEAQPTRASALLRARKQEVRLELGTVDGHARFRVDTGRGRPIVDAVLQRSRR